jgi:nucleotide-binding universal stress UspA family protein
MSTPIFRKLLVADDGSPNGERAASVGVRLAARLEAEVILFGVVGTPNVQMTVEGMPGDYQSTCRRKMEERFERFLDLGRALGVAMSVQFVERRPAEQIRKCAEADNVDLIIVGRRRLSKIQIWLGGSTSETVLRKTACSVMIAR